MKINLKNLTTDTLLTITGILRTFEPVVIAPESSVEIEELDLLQNFREVLTFVYAPEVLNISEVVEQVAEPVVRTRTRTPKPVEETPPPVIDKVEEVIPPVVDEVKEPVTAPKETTE